MVATGRTPERVSAALGAHDDLLAVKLDVTDPADAEATVQAGVVRFGRLDVLVNNAGNFYAGFFEVFRPEALVGFVHPGVLVDHARGPGHRGKR